MGDDGGRLIDFYPYRERFRTYHRVDAEGRDRQSILEELATMAAEEDGIADRGRVSGSIYHGDHDHYRFLTEPFACSRTQTSSSGTLLALGARDRHLDRHRRAVHRHPGGGDHGGSAVRGGRAASSVGGAGRAVGDRGDRRRDRDPVAFAAMAADHNVIWLGAWMFVDGFVLLACLPVVLDWSEVHAGPERQGAAVGFLMMAGNLGGLVLVLAIQPLIANPYICLGLLAVVALLGLPAVMRLPARART
ncbi:MAG TPA: hypothetical protein VKT20_03130 [Candidatus Dormibacteraeota bacterium]|nr:hypothetical protein [Candidatus Dormibacteraeota bacterium]